MDIHCLFHGAGGTTRDRAGSDSWSNRHIGQTAQSNFSWLLAGISPQLAHLKVAPMLVRLFILIESLLWPYRVGICLTSIADSGPVTMVDHYGDDYAIRNNPSSRRCVLDAQIEWGNSFVFGQFRRFLFGCGWSMRIASGFSRTQEHDAGSRCCLQASAFPADSLVGLNTSARGRRSSTALVGSSAAFEM